MRLWQLVGVIGIQAASGLICCQTLAAEPSKPIQECEQEFRTREVSLHSAGINAASFFHECWWHSRRGHLTELSSDGARDRALRVQQDADATQLWTGKKVSTQSSTGDHVPSKNFIDRREKRREARFQRHMNGIIEARAKKLMLASRPHYGGKRMIVADARGKGRRLAIREKRLALLTRREAERRVRYARGGINRLMSADTQVIQASVDIPANAIDGRRSWIGTDTDDGVRQIPAVVIGALKTTAVKGTALHCWNQDVLYLSKSIRWQQSLVCDNKTEASAQRVWFEHFEARR